MARKASTKAQKSVKKAMHERKEGTLKSGKGGKGGTVKSKKQAIAIGLSEGAQGRRQGSQESQQEDGEQEEGEQEEQLVTLSAFLSKITRTNSRM